MRAERSTPILILALGVALVMGVAAQEPPPPVPDDETSGDRKRTLAARVARLRGRVLVQTPGEGGWTEVRESALLSAGDSVRAEDGAVELVLPGSEAAVRDLGAEGAERVVLAPDARVTVAPPGSDVRLRLDEGGCFAAGADGLRVQAGETTVTVRGGDAELELSRNGGVTVTVHSGSVDVDPTSAAPARSLSEGERLSVNARGVPVVRPASRVRPPDYVTGLDRVEPERVLFVEMFREWPGGWHDAHPPERTREGHLSSTTLYQAEGATLDPEDHRSEVRFGKSTTAKGSWIHVAGLRMRVRYRLSRAAPLRVVLNCPLGDESRHFESSPVPARAGGWNELEFRPEHFVLRHGPPEQPRIEPGELITYVSMFAGELAGPTPTLEVSRVLVYTGRP